MNSTLKANATTINTGVSSITNIVNTIDISIRWILLTTHLIYFIIVIFFKELQKISNLNIHHSNFIGLLSAIQYCAWINKTTLNYSSQELNNFLCSLSEIFWPVSKYARAYSILVLGVYRYIAVFHIKTFTKIAVSLKYNLFSASLAWTISLIVFIVSKYSLSTVPSSVMCVDGGTSSLTISIIYYVITTLFGLLVPTILVLVSYILIHFKLKKLSKNLQSKDENSKRNSENKSKENKLAIQMIVLNAFDLLSIVFLMLLTVTRWIPLLDKDYPYFRQLWRLLNNLSQSVMPLISLIFHPFKLRFKYTIFFKNKIDVSSLNTISNTHH